VNKHATTLLFLFAGAMLFNYGASVPGGQTSTTTQSLTQNVSSSTTPKRQHHSRLSAQRRPWLRRQLPELLSFKRPDPKPVSLAPKTQAR
jgi:hypothetical protein